MHDIYFEHNYGKLYEQIEKGIALVFNYKSDYGEIKHLFIKRKIPMANNGEVYYDLITPYGYGGPVIINYKTGNKQELLEGFHKKFKEYCLQNNIVSEFVRFHPIISNHKDFKNIYNPIYVRNTVATKVEPDEDPFEKEFSKSARKTIRRAFREGVTYKITKSPNDIKSFLEIYYSTMNRKEASDYYYFDPNYFEKCLKYFKENVLLIEVIYDNKTVAMAFYFVYNKVIHAHLSGTLTEYLNLSPAYIIKYATAEWAKDNNIKLIHYGGGVSNSSDDSLYKFKKKFTRETEYKFYVAKKVWNEKVYKELSANMENRGNVDFFPAYRYE